MTKDCIMRKESAYLLVSLFTVIPLWCIGLPTFTKKKKKNEAVLRNFG